MCYKMLLVATVLCILSLTHASLPSFLKACKSSDKACSTASATNAVPYLAVGQPEWGFERMDPCHFKEVDSSLPNLKFILSDITLTGLKGCEVTNLVRDAPTSKMNLTLVCTVRIDGHYELAGNLLSFPLNGHGKMHAELFKAEFVIMCDMETKTGDDGEKYWHIKKFVYEFHLHNPSDVKFHDLFEENKILSQAAEELFKTNGNLVVTEIGNGMIKAAVTRIIKNVNNLFAKLAVKFLSLD